MKQFICILATKEDSIRLLSGSLPYETMTEEDLVRMTLDGEVLEGERKPSSEWRLHAEVYRQKPEISSVIHTHSPYATSFAVNNQSIPVILIEMVPLCHTWNC